MTYQIHQRDAELRGEARGRAEGRAEGEERKAKEFAVKLYRRGSNLADIADIVGYTADTIRNWLGLAPA